MQAFYFRSGIGDAPCAEAPNSGILIQTPEGRQALVDALKAALARPFATQLPGPQVADVLFTAFVVQ